MKAVVARALNDIAVLDVDLEPPKAGEVRVKMRATGVCHSDLSIINGTIAHKLPAVVGHEGAGLVDAVGDGVSRVRPGDSVVMSFVPQCGECFYCERGEPFCCERNVVDGGLLDGTSRVRLDGEEIAVTLFQGNMAEYAVVPECCCVAVDPEFDYRVAALVSCGVTTGVGAVIRTAGVTPGSTVAVFGCGGVGLNVVQGARIAGATTIIAVDLSTEKLELARSFGATETARADDNPLRAIREITGGRGVDYAFDVVGNGRIVETCVKATRMNGTTILVGIGGKDDTFTLNTLAVPMTGKTIRGCLYGSADIRVDIPRYLEMYRRGMLDIERLISRTYTIDEAPQAFRDLADGGNARGVIVY